MATTRTPATAPLRLQLAAAALALVTTWAALSGVMELADGYRGDAQLAAARSAAPAASQVVLLGAPRPGKG